MSPLVVLLGLIGSTASLIGLTSEDGAETTQKNLDASDSRHGAQQAGGQSAKAAIAQKQAADRDGDQDGGATTATHDTQDTTQSSTSSTGTTTATAPTPQTTDSGAAEPETDDSYTVAANTVTAPVQTGTGGISGADAGTSVHLDGSELQVITGRVTTLTPEGDDIAAVRVIDGPAHGNLTVNPDNSLALVLTETGHTGGLQFSYEVTRGDGSTEVVETTVNAVPGPVEGGWGMGKFYMLETDEEGDLVVEWGDNHRDLYISGSDDALSLADIAALEGMSVDQITAHWLSNNPEYGGSEGMALDVQVGETLWRKMMSDSYDEPASHWLRLEAGYEYDFGKLLRAGIRGESELHPMHITSYGEGAKPIVSDQLLLAAESAENLVISNIDLGGGVRFNGGENIILENITSTEDELVVENVTNFTLRNSEIYDVVRHDSLTDEYWQPHINRMSGFYGAKNDGILMEGNLFDKIAWDDGYDTGMSLDDPMPPSIYSHNVYIQTNNLDVTFRDNISMRAASFGAQIRSGGFVEDNVFIDNNAAVYVAGGVSDGTYYGNYSLYSDNLVTDAGHRLYGSNDGQLSGGIGDYAPLTSLVDNIVAHMADPNDPNGTDGMSMTNDAMKGGDEAYYNDTTVYNWHGETREQGYQDANVAGLDHGTLDATTIQKFTAELLGKADATIEDLAQYLRASADIFDGMSDAEMIIEFFQAGFGLTPDARLEAEMVRFTPSDLGDGVRWDNRLNWTTEDLPGTLSGDSVDLAGNWVHYGGTTAIEDLDFGAGGKLTVTHGKLTVNGDTGTDGAGGHLSIDEAGQVWMSGYGGTAAMDIDVDGGRFANTGTMDGAIDLRATDGQVLLATEGGTLDLGNGSRVEIVGDDAQTGFEGLSGGAAVLRIEEGGTLRFEAADGGLGTIGEIRSGAHGDAATDVASGMNLGEGTLQLDLSGLGTEAGDHTLISVDQMVGAFSQIDVSGLGNGRDARLVFDYDKDEVILRITAEGAGSGELNMSILGEGADDAAEASAELWDALTEGMPPAADQLPDEVTLDGTVLTDLY